MKVVTARNQKRINLTAVEPIRHVTIHKEAPAEQRKSVATTFLDQQVFLVCNLAIKTTCGVISDGLNCEVAFILRSTGDS